MIVMTQRDLESEPYQTLASRGQAELVVERSRFIAHAMPVGGVEDAEALVADLRREHHSARHVCYGLRIGRFAQCIDRSNDDGEPSRTGGFPLWQLLEGHEVTDALIAVVRYFGGVKLGMGGLARAYREAGRQAMLAASVVRRWPEVTVRLTVPYALLDRLIHLIQQMEGARIVDTSYAVTPTLTLAIRKADSQMVRERTAALVQRDPDLLFEKSPV